MSRHDPPTTMDPRAWALWHVRTDVERGYSVDMIADGHHGRSIPPRFHGFSVRISTGDDIWYGEEYHGTGGMLRWPHRLRVRHTEIGVVLDDRVAATFRITDLAREIRSGLTQISMFGAIA